ncbi:hypothetical protein SKAU_G00112570 [Synaphobranchus kaupii]|uniref:Uncharacterized protein n=1 Tax=Synaphobranchus kaupii TaxID=118154 RepID=A0A9Q1G0H2_SYNKA|nr:hypothetical protein SKAU_G00112570 [Synaphobranchus kaupii]
MRIRYDSSHFTALMVETFTRSRRVIKRYQSGGSTSLVRPADFTPDHPLRRGQLRPPQHANMNGVLASGGTRDESRDLHIVLLHCDLFICWNRTHSSPVYYQRQWELHHFRQTALQIRENYSLKIISCSPHPFPLRIM